MVVENCAFVRGSFGSGARQIYIKNPSCQGQVQMPTWSAEGGQEDLVWYQAKDLGGGLWVADIECRKLKHSGTVHAHIYVGSQCVSVVTAPMCMLSIAMLLLDEQTGQGRRYSLVPQAFL